MLVNRILDRLEEHYENTTDVPENWWSLEEAQFLMRNYPQYNFTDDELDRASEVAIQQFYEDNPHAAGDHTQFFVMDIVEDILDLVLGLDLPTEFDAEQYEFNTTPHAALGGSTPLQILKGDPSTWPESWHRGNRLADLD